MTDKTKTDDAAAPVAVAEEPTEVIESVQDPNATPPSDMEEDPKTLITERAQLLLREMGNLLGHLIDRAYPSTGTAPVASTEPVGPRVDVEDYNGDGVSWDEYPIFTGVRFADSVAFPKARRIKLVDCVLEDTVELFTNVEKCQVYFVHCSVAVHHLRDVPYVPAADGVDVRSPG